MKKQLILALTIFAVTFTACKKDDHDDDHGHDHENELITTVKLNLTDTATGQTQTFTWRQPGGPGTAITIDTVKLVSGKFYSATTEVWDESQNPAKNITAEVAELKNEHRFIYTSSTSRLSINITDFDTNNPPIEVGLSWNAITNNTGDANGSLQVVLKHYSGTTPKTSGPQAGSTDIDVSFPLVIE